MLGRDASPCVPSTTSGARRHAGSRWPRWTDGAAARSVGIRLALPELEREVALLGVRTTSVELLDELLGPAAAPRSQQRLHGDESLRIARELAQEPDQLIAGLQRLASQAPDLLVGPARGV